MSLACAPFPEGWQGDLDETFQQFCTLASAYIESNFLTGLYYPVGTTPAPTLPTTDQGPVAMNGVWYFWDPVSGQYLPQSQSVKPAKNYVKNCIYQVQQYSVAAIPAGITKVCDMAQVRATLANVLAASQTTGPAASPDTDYCPLAQAYTVGATLVPTLAATDLYAHEHLIEGCDIAMLLGEPLTLGLSVWVSVPGTYSVYLTSTGRDASYVANFTVSTASAWIRVKVNNIPALPTGMGTWNFQEGQTGLYIGVVLATGSQWQAGSAQVKTWQNAFLAGSATNSNLCTATNNQIRVTAVKLEASPVATYLSVPSFEADFHDAIRYYWSSFNYQSLTNGVPVYGAGQSAGNFVLSVPFPRRMCKVPTVVPYGWSSKAAGNITDISSATDIATATLGAVAKGVSASGAAAGVAKGDPVGCFVIADARLS